MAGSVPLQPHRVQRTPRSTAVRHLYLIEQVGIPTTPVLSDYCEHTRSCVGGRRACGFIWSLCLALLAPPPPPFVPVGRRSYCTFPLSLTQALALCH